METLWWVGVLLVIVQHGPHEGAVLLVLVEESHARGHRGVVCLVRAIVDSEVVSSEVVHSCKGSILVWVLTSALFVVVLWGLV